MQIGTAATLRTLVFAGSSPAEGTKYFPVWTNMVKLPHSDCGAAKAYCRFESDHGDQVWERGSGKLVQSLGLGPSAFGGSNPFAPTDHRTDSSLGKPRGKSGLQRAGIVALWEINREYV